MDLPTQIQDRLDRLGVLVGDIEERFVRGSGPGGQKINKTSSTVCLRHRPTGVDVRVQRERLQSANRELAWRELCEKLEKRLADAERERRSAIELARRRKRQKSGAQKHRMIADKKHRGRAKTLRGRVQGD